MNAYVNYNILNTVTSSLIDDHVWAPIKENPQTMEFKSISIAGNNLTINVGVDNIDVMREYQSALIDMSVLVDKNNIDKIPGVERTNDDIEISKFKDQFTTEIVKFDDPMIPRPYLGTLNILINKNITEDMQDMLGSD
jgi:hypothetical protein